MNWFLAYSSHVYINITTYPVEITTFNFFNSAKDHMAHLKGGCLFAIAFYYFKGLDEVKAKGTKGLWPKGADAVQQKKR
jgi:hypothetical protein